jgi:sporulation protein YlmC with PRC-barrel domain
MDDITTNVSGRLISADKVAGTTVFNYGGEKLGHVESVMIDKATGQVAYAILSFGGFLGLGDSHHPLPWRTLRYDRDKGGYVVDLDKATLEGAPQYRSGETIDWSTPEYGRRVDEYYRVPSYWI